MSGSTNESNAARRVIDSSELGEVFWKNNVYNSTRYRDETARSIANWLILIFALVIAAQYVFTIWLTLPEKIDALAVVEKLFSVVLPVVSGFVGAAVTYYFTKDRP